MNRQQAWDILTDYTKNESLLKHGLAVEAAMRAYAHKYGEDEERWGVVGLLHDFDYEIHPTLEEHPAAGEPILRERGVPEDVVYAVLSHADHLGLERKGLLEKTLCAVDELTGFLVAVALVRPNKSIHEVEARSVRKKMKDKAFARAVRREDIINGAALLDVPLDEHLNFVIQALRGIAEELGLQGDDMAGMPDSRGHSIP